MSLTVKKDMVMSFCTLSTFVLDPLGVCVFVDRSEFRVKLVVAARNYTTGEGERPGPSGGPSAPTAGTNNFSEFSTGLVPPRSKLS